MKGAMSTVPHQRLPRLAFYRAHLEVWSAAAAQLGLSEAELAAFAAELDEAQSLALALRQARQAARSAKEAFLRRYQTVSARGSSLIGAIRAQAAAQGEQVYVAARLPPPKTPSPLPPPGKPYAPRVDLLPGGALQLRWRCQNPARSAGVVYEIQRCADGGAAVYLGTVGRRRFIDTTLPAGTAAALYTVTPLRSTARGEGEVFPVYLGNADVAPPGGRPRRAA